MNGSPNDPTLLPSELDKNRLEQMAVDGRMEAENATWVALRYPASVKKGPRWCEYTLVINHPKVSGMADFKNTKALLAYLSQAEQERRRRNKG